MKRRQALKSAVAASVFSLFADVSGASSDVHETETLPLNFLASKEAEFWRTDQERDRYLYALGRAVLDFIQDHFPQGDLPVWKQPLPAIDLEKRVMNILYWMVRGVDRYHRIYPVDPAWLMAQILEESFFYEFAVSWAFAVGVCQFIQPTATTLGMVCPTTSDLPEQEINNSEMAAERERLRELSAKRRELKNTYRTLFYKPGQLLEEILKGGEEERVSKGEAYLPVMEEVRALERSMKQARKNYRDFLLSNYQGRSIFRKKDLGFLNRFDQRVLYRLPVQAMVRMMAEHLRGRKGNILAATAGYNAGLPSTRYPYRIYEPYGMVPAYRETVRYVCKIAINYQEIKLRLA